MFSRKKLERRLESEIDYHIERVTQSYVAQGWICKRRAGGRFWSSAARRRFAKICAMCIVGDGWPICSRTWRMRRARYGVVRGFWSAR